VSAVLDDSVAHPLVFGEVLFDCFAGGERVLGGAPFNVAWHLQGLGLAPVFVSAVGADPAGAEIAAAMERHSMTTVALQRHPVYGTGEVRVSVEHGQPAYEIVADRAYDHVRADLLPRVRAALVYHGTLGLRGADSVAALDRLIAASRAPVFVDVNLREPWWRPEPVLALLGRARWAKMNEDELATLAGDRGDPRAAAARLLAATPLEQLVVTRGAEGAFCVTRGRALVESVPVEALPVVDTVGAGDAFAAVWIAGLLLGWQEDLTMTRAQALAARIVVQRGALIHDETVYRALRSGWSLS
jgi:fructokinase